MSCQTRQKNNVTTTPFKHLIQKNKKQINKYEDIVKTKSRIVFTACIDHYIIVYIVQKSAIHTEQQ